MKRARIWVMAVEKAMCHVVRKRAIIIISMGFWAILRRIEDERRETHGSLRICQLAIKFLRQGVTD